MIVNIDYPFIFSLFTFYFIFYVREGVCFDYTCIGDVKINTLTSE